MEKNAYHSLKWFKVYFFYRQLSVDYMIPLTIPLSEDTMLSSLNPAEKIHVAFPW